MTQSPTSSSWSSNAASPQELAIPTGDSVRTGSPFAAGSSLPQPGTSRWRESQSFGYEAIGQGVWRETATSAVFACWMLVGFATAGWLWFPSGGCVIALLGLAMSLFGFSSRYHKLSGIGLLIHGVILAGCYFRLL